MTSKVLKIVPAAMLVATLALAQQPAQPQATPAAPAATQPSTPVEVRNWRAGVKLSAGFLSFFDESQLNTFNSTTWKYSYAATTDISNHLGFGMTFGYDVSSRVTLNVDALYRRAGFRSGLDITEGEDNEDTDEDERKYTSGFLQTKLDYWDVPVTLRIHDGPAARRVRGFIEAGVVLRHAASVRSYSEMAEPGETAVVDTTPGKISHPNTLGGVIGAGWDWRTNRQVHFVPQLRYTHWAKPVLDTSSARSARGQIEFLLGITF